MKIIIFNNISGTDNNITGYRVWQGKIQCCGISFFTFLLKYSWFTMSCFRCTKKVIHLYINIYFFKFFSLIVYYCCGIFWVQHLKQVNTPKDFSVFLFFFFFKGTNHLFSRGVLYLMSYLNKVNKKLTLRKFDLNKILIKD